VLGAVVDDALGPEGSRELDLVVAADGGDDPRAHETGDLDRGAADAAAGRLDQHRLAGPEPRPGDEGVPGGEHRERERGARLERDRRGQRPSSRSMSTWLSAHARTRTTTSSGPGAGSR